MAEQKKYLDKTGLTYFFNKIKEIFISDAPIDGKKYLRQDNNWVEYTGGGSTEDVFQVVENTLLTDNSFQTAGGILVLS